MIFPSNHTHLTNADFPHFEGKNITFGITGDCNLRCTYCYIHEKRLDREMSFETAKQIVDRMFEEPYAYLDDNFSEKNTVLEKTDPNRDITKKVIFDFIGGEPFIRGELIDKISDYIKYKAVSDPRRYLFRFSFSTNGVTFLDDDVQDYLKKNKELVSVGITIDGTRDMHDACRIFPDGSGSYDQVIHSIGTWQDQYNGLSTKVTIAPENLSRISDALFHLWQDVGIQHVPANVVFEPVWKPEHEAVFEEELIKIKDFLLRDRNYTRYCTTLFDETIGEPIDPEDIRNSCGGDGKMLFWDHAGTFYNCIRFAPVSCLDGSGYSLGNLEDGYTMENYNRLKSMTRRTCSDDECFHCEVASGCSYCPGQQYDEHGDFNIRSKSIFEYAIFNGFMMFFFILSKAVSAVIIRANRKSSHTQTFRCYSR